MSHAPIYFARKLKTDDQRRIFWHFVTIWEHDGETAYYMVLRGVLPCPRS